MLGWESHFDWYFSFFRWFNHHQPPAIRWGNATASVLPKTPRTLSAAQLAAGHPKMATYRQNRKRHPKMGHPKKLQALKINGWNIIMEVWLNG